MKKKVVLWVDEEEERVLRQALRMYQQSFVSAITSTDFQREVVTCELAITNELLNQIQSQQDQVALPTISALPVGLGREDWKRNFCELQAGGTAAIVACGTDGEQIQVSYDAKDQAFSITIDGKLELKNQHIGTVVRKFKEMIAE